MTGDRAFSLPEDFRRHTVQRGRDEAAWLRRLPGIVRGAIDAWDLTLEPHFANLSYNYVAPVRQSRGTPAVLKACFPSEDFRCEAAALAAFDGHACVRLLRSDLDAGLLLLEHVSPGEMLHTLEEDAAETSAAAAVMRNLWRLPPDGAVFPRAETWLRDALDPAAIPGLKRRLPWIETALARGAELASQPGEQLLLHGDLHHDNILAAQRQPWLAIDPHGVIGEAAWEVAPYLFNNLERFNRHDWPAVIRRRAGQFADELTLDRERLHAWSAVRAIQSAFWSLKEAPTPEDDAVFEGALVCAQALIAP